MANMLGEITLGEVRGAICDLIEKLSGENGSEWLTALKKFLRKENPWVVTETKRSWLEENGIIYFSVTSDGTTGEEWIKILENNDFRVGEYAKRDLRSPNFKPTNGVTTKIAILKGALFKDRDRTTKEIRTEANKRRLSKPSAELACLIRKKFTDKEIEEMGLCYIIVMHEPFDNSGVLSLLSADCDGCGNWLSNHNGTPNIGWCINSGFAFSVSEIN
ncbi:MAG: hypothetical protein WCL61_03115 [bacterium]